MFTPCGQGYTFEAPTRFDKLFSGIVAPRPAFIERSPTGTEHIGPDDTVDGDYERLLEQASRRWLANARQRGRGKSVKGVRPQLPRVGTSSANGYARWTACGGRRESAKGLALQDLDKSLNLTEIPIARRALEQRI